MLHFHVWVNLKDGADDRDFAERAQEFLSDLHARELCEGYAITRREFVQAPPELGRFHVTVAFAATDQLNRAFAFAGAATDETRDYHEAFSRLVRGLSTALYKDFPERPPRRPIRL